MTDLRAFACYCPFCGSWSSVSRLPLETIRYVCPDPLCGETITSGPPLVDLYLEEPRARLAAAFAAPAAARTLPRRPPAAAPAAAGSEQLELSATARTPARALPADRVPCPANARRYRLHAFRHVTCTATEAALLYRRWFGQAPVKRGDTCHYTERELRLCGAL